MKKIRLFLLACALFVLACNALNQPLSFLATPTPTASEVGTDCPDPQPSQEYIDSVLKYNAELFASSDWAKSYTVMESRVMVTWQSDPLNAVANYDHVIFCNATRARVDDYYSESNFDLIFQNYEGHEFQKDCRDGDVHLYELKVKSHGEDYNAKYWIEIADSDHVRGVLLVFPIDDLKNMNSYSKKMMPKLPSCD